MTTETTAPAASKTLEEMLAELSGDNAEAVRKVLEKALSKQERDSAKKAEKEAEDAMQTKGVEWAQAVQQAAIDAASALGIVIPEKGIKRTIEMTRATDGSIMASIVVPTPRVASAGGTRAARGTGTGKASVMQVSGLSGFVLADGTEVKSASAVTKALAKFVEGENAGRVLVKIAREDAALANTVKANVNGNLIPLGDLVASEFPVTTPAAVPPAV